MLLPLLLPAQAVVRDAGARLNAGLWYPTGGNGDAGFSWEGAVFYSHWFCGQLTGYHLEAGLAQTRLDYPSADIRQLRPFAGAYAKLRPVKYNRPQELAFLLGPRLDYIVAQSPEQPAAEDAQFGIHGAIWYRLPRGRDNSWFLQTGLTYYPTRPFSGGPSGTYLVTLGIGTTWFHD